MGNTGRGDEPTHVIRDTGSDDTKREHRPVNTESTNSEDEAGASSRKSHVKSAPESSYSYTIHTDLHSQCPGKVWCESRQ